MSTTKVAAEVLRILRERGLVDKVLDFLLKKEPMTVLIMGASGTGKSAFLRKLYDEEPFIHPNDRSRINEAQAGKVEGTLFNMIATPGQRDAVHGKTRLEAIKEAAAVGRLGILNVVSYGYHEVSDSIAKALDGGTVREAYLASRRSEELLMIPEWVRFLCGPGGKASWLITVITKADIWWGTDEHAGKGQGLGIIDYYMHDPYLSELGEAAKLPHAVHSYSALNQKFYGVVSPSGHYTDAQRKTDHNALIATLLDYASKKK